MMCFKAVGSCVMMCYDGGLRVCEVGLWGGVVRLCEIG